MRVQWTVRARFAKLHLKEPQTRPKWKCLATMHSDGVLIQVCFAATAPGHGAFIESTVNSSVYPRILEWNNRSSVWQLICGWNWVTSQDNDPKHSSKYTAAIHSFSFVYLEKHLGGELESVPSSMDARRSRPWTCLQLHIGLTQRHRQPFTAYRQFRITY